MDCLRLRQIVWFRRRLITMKKTIIITGATKGLGHALTEKYISLGHTVIGCGRDAQAISAMKEKWSKAPCDFQVVDVTKDSDVQKWAQNSLTKFGAPDLLINNAATINRRAPLWEQTNQEIEDILAVNLRGVINCIRHFVPAMIKNKKGVIINLSSGWGRSVSPEVAPYCMTKWAIEGLTLALAEEIPKSMAAIPLSPGVIHTEMLEKAFGHSEAKGYPTPEKWAEVSAEFILKLSAKDSGQSLSVPGFEK